MNPFDELFGSDDDLSFGDDEPEATAPEPSSDEDTSAQLTRLAGEQARKETQEARELANRRKAEEKLAGLRERREELLGHLNAADLDEEAKDALGRHVEQLTTELDMQIEELEAVAPWANLSMEDLGAFELGEASVGGRRSFLSADGQVGDSARALEDAEAGLYSAIQDRLPDIAGRTDLNAQEKAAHVLAMFESKQPLPLRVRDALTEMLDARQRVDALVGEVDRRKSAALLAQENAQQALELATAKADAIDAATRKQIAADTTMTAEDKAVELARLSVPMSERQGEGERWSEIVADAEEATERATYERRLLKRLDGQSTLISADSPLMKFLVEGEQMAKEIYESFADPDALKLNRSEKDTRDAALLRALRGLGGVDGVKGPKQETTDVLVNTGEQFYRTVDEAIAAQQQKHHEAIKQLTGENR